MVTRIAALCAFFIFSAAQAAVIKTQDAITIDNDPVHMNWVLSPGQYPWVAAEDRWGSVTFKGELEFSHEEQTQDGDVIERFVFTNRTATPQMLTDLAIKIPFNDNYPDAKTCTSKRCNTHLWPGGTNGWVCALRMGGQGPHLGLMITEGSFDGYAVDKRSRETGSSNFRGVFSLLSNDRTLAPGESYTLAWRLFAHNGWEDFKAQLLARGGTWTEADEYVLTPGEATSSVQEELSFPSNGTYRARGCEFVVRPAFPDLLKARLDFILAHQQYNNPDDIRDGAFLPYDNETDTQECDWLAAKHSYDHDEGRERLGMGVLLAEAMRDWSYANPAARPVLDRYCRFVHRALQNADFKTFSEVLRPKHRIYNYAWTARLFFDAWEVTGNPDYLEWAYQTALATFKFGGYKFYMIEFPIEQGYNDLCKAGRTEDAARFLSEVRKWADFIAETGLDVPRSEVNYEQSIIAPAAVTMAEMYRVTHEEKYRRAAEVLLPAVESFNGHQPSAYLNDIAIRHWDAYWFGKRQTWGDTFPHYWSGITAEFFRRWATITGEAEYLRRAEAIVKGNFALFTPDGRAGCAYVYPDRIDGKPGKFLDPLANDQDWALVFAGRVLGARTRACAFPWEADNTAEDLREWVEPDTVLCEPHNDWRPVFTPIFAEVVKDCPTASAAVQAINRVIWERLGVQYSTKRDAALQSPFHSMRTHKASCTGMAILQVCAYRSVGIPARLVGCNWTTLKGNHSWVEFKEKGKWHFFGDGDPSPIDQSWIAPFAAEADATRPDRRIYASRATHRADEQACTHFWTTWEPKGGWSGVPADDVTESYRRFRRPDTTIDLVPEHTNYQKHQ